MTHNPETFASLIERAIARETTGNHDLVTTRIEMSRNLEKLKSELEQLVIESRESLADLEAGRFPNIGHNLATLAGKAIASRTALEIHATHLAIGLNEAQS